VDLIKEPAEIHTNAYNVCTTCGGRAATWGKAAGQSVCIPESNSANWLRPDLMCAT